MNIRFYEKPSYIIPYFKNGERQELVQFTIENARVSDVCFNDDEECYEIVIESESPNAFDSWEETIDSIIKNFYTEGLGSISAHLQSKILRNDKTNYACMLKINVAFKYEISDSNIIKNIKNKLDKCAFSNDNNLTFVVYYIGKSNNNIYYNITSINDNKKEKEKEKEKRLFEYLNENEDDNDDTDDNDLNDDEDEEEKEEDDEDEDEDEEEEKDEEIPQDVILDMIENCKRMCNNKLKRSKTFLEYLNEDPDIDCNEEYRKKKETALRNVIIDMERNLENLNANRTSVNDLFDLHHHLVDSNSPRTSLK